MKIELGNVQNLMMREPTIDCVRREKELRYELSVLEKVEEKFYQQKSRAQFVREEDQNSAYFFRKVVVRQKRNTVYFLYNRQGQKLESYEEISAELVDYFSSTLGVRDDKVHVVSDSLLKEILGNELDNDSRNALLALVSRDEIKAVMFGILLVVVLSTSASQR
ncbi:hypothetical protein V6N13_141232 [Hibiscus sabdariffa]|uniref:Uncharacterized protein n=1 Tax=Hibiscus sabdariffa TaxID=183260 RepID=A0ABR2Q0G4_9ROSI